MSINRITTDFNAIQPIIKGDQTIPAQQTKSLGAPESFQKFMTDAFKEVDSLQTEADKKIESLVMGKGEVTTHEAMIALEKADVAFQLMSQVRQKIVRAYEEIMRTQI